MNKEIKINLNDFAEIKKFINITRSFVSDIDVIRGKVTLDGKSLLGLMALDLSRDIYVRIISDDIAEIRKFDAEMEAFR